MANNVIMTVNMGAKVQITALILSYLSFFCRDDGIFDTKTTCFGVEELCF